MFELTILFSAFTAFFGVFILNRLPRLHHPLFDYEPFNRVTNDAFFLVIESTDPNFQRPKLENSLKELAAQKSLSFTRMIKNFLIAFILLTIITIALLGFQGQHREATGIEFFGDMKRQDKVKFQKPSSFFADGRGARPPVDGAIPMGYDIPRASHAKCGSASDDIDSPLGEFSAGTDYLNTGKMGDQWGTGLPLPVTPEFFRRGQKEFTINCAVCHGATGQGNGITSKYGLLGIANYHQDKYRQMADGQIFNTITHGFNTMMAYGDKVTVKDRWAIIAYIRALQKSEFARLEDVPPIKEPPGERSETGEYTSQNAPAPQQNAPTPQQNVPEPPANTQTKQTR